LLQAVNPVAPLARVGRGMRTARGVRAAAAGRQASRMADASRAARRSGDIMAGSIDEAAQVRAAAARQLQNRTMTERGLSAFDTRTARMAGRLPQIAGLAEEQGLLAAAAGFGMNRLMGGLGQQIPGMSGMGSQPQSFGAGSAMGAGAGNLANVQGNATADRVIFDPLLAQGNQALTGFEGQQEFGGFGVRTGEDMYIGDRLMKSVVEDMHRKALLKKEGLCKGGCGQTIKMCGCEKTVKAECPKCGKNCSCDQKNKADKKPAHGMVIVIGSKAGPGPMTEGKRDKLDSEKGSDKDD